MTVMINNIDIKNGWEEMKVSELIEAIKTHFDGVEYVKNTPDDYGSFHTAYSFKPYTEPEEMVYEYQWYKFNQENKVVTIKDHRGYYFTKDEVSDQCIKIENTKRIRSKE